MAFQPHGKYISENTARRSVDDLEWYVSLLGAYDVSTIMSVESPGAALPRMSAKRLSATASRLGSILESPAISPSGFSAYATRSTNQALPRASGLSSGEPSMPTT